MADSATKLYYFATNGAADPIRFLLFQFGVEFEDIRFTEEEWPKVKEELGADCTFGQVPLLKYEGKTLVQTRAILYYLGAKFGIIPRGVEEEFSTSWYLDVKEDMMHSVTKDFHGSEEEKKVAQEKLLTTDLPLFLKGMEEKFNADGVTDRGYLVTDKPSLADFAIICFLENLFYHSVRKERYSPVLVANAPNIAAWLDKKLEEFNGYFTSKYRPPTTSG